METPLVSVIVPSYCHQDYILASLQSVAAQTWQRIELIVIDDESSDGSWQLLQELFASEFLHRFERTSLIANKTNLGAYATLNRGIDLSVGSHIALLNSDDAYEPDRLTCLMEALKTGGDIGEGGQDLAFSLVNIEMSGDGEIDPFFRLLPLRQHLALRRDPTVGLSLVRANHAISTGNLLFTRRLWNQAGPFQPFDYCHDWDFLLQSLFFTEPAVVARPLYKYRLHGTNSFRSLRHKRDIELEVTMKRLFRRGLIGKSPNPFFPSEANWPNFLEAFAEQCRIEMHLRLERGEGAAGWRIYG